MRPRSAVVPLTPEPPLDVLIIGAGQAGIPLSHALAKAGKRVAIAERKDLGGSCINFGCTPTKAVIASARAAYLARRAAVFGLRVPKVEIDFPAVLDRARSILMVVARRPPARFRGIRQPAARARPCAPRGARGAALQGSDRKRKPVGAPGRPRHRNAERPRLDPRPEEHSVSPREQLARPGRAAAPHPLRGRRLHRARDGAVLPPDGMPGDDRRPRRSGPEVGRPGHRREPPAPPGVGGDPVPPELPRHARGSNAGAGSRRPSRRRTPARSSRPPTSSSRRVDGPIPTISASRPSA